MVMERKTAMNSHVKQLLAPKTLHLTVYFTFNMLVNITPVILKCLVELM